MSSLINIPLSAALLYLLKVVLISVEIDDSLCEMSRKDIVKFPGEPVRAKVNSKTFVTEWLNLISKNYLLISQTAVYKLSFNKYKEISCQDTSFTDTLKIIYPASQTARGHIIKSAVSVFFWSSSPQKTLRIMPWLSLLADIINLTVMLDRSNLFPRKVRVGIAWLMH